MEEDQNMSIILSHNYQNPHILSDDKNKINKELMLMLLQLASQSKFEHMNPDTLKNLKNDLISLINLRKISFNYQEVSNKFCSECKEFFTMSLQCGCYICKHLHQTIETQLQEYFGNTLNDLYEFLQSIKCPRCGRDVNEKDLERLYPEFRTKKDELQIIKIQQNINQYKYFVCENCNKARGPEMLPKSEVLGCHHMCSICICKGYFETKSLSCKHCDARINLEDLSHDKRTCSQCKSSCYLLGDRMLESSPGALLCLYCIAESVNKGTCPITGRIYTFEEKREFYQYIFTQCFKCGSDIFHLNAERLKCCKNVYCTTCTNLGYCPQCKLKI